MKKILLYIIILQCAFVQYAGAQVFNGYYNDANGKTGAALKSALAKVINPHTQLSYTEVWGAIEKLDIRSDGNMLDRYSNTTNYVPVSDRAGNYSGEGDVYNREHSFPKSWFHEDEPMYTDLVHMIASDGFVNGMRSNHPFGETNGNSYKSNNGYSKLGSCTTEGYSGTVFEPADEWKGDFARIYFYMVTSYEGQIAGWSSDMLDKKSYPGLSTWALKMLLRWAKNDPVSEVEKKRNNGVEEEQGNRNPFVDFEGLEQFIWGQFRDSIPDLNNYKSIYALIEGDGSENVPDNPGGDTPGGDTPGGGDNPGGDVTGAIFSETFKDCDGTGGNDGSWSGSIASKDYTSETWSITKGYKADGCVKFGSSSAGGSATTPSITVTSDNTYILTFRAGAWSSSSENTTLNLSLSGGVFEGSNNETTVTLEKGAFKSYTFNITATGPALRITFASGGTKNSRFFLDDVILKSSTTGIGNVNRAMEGPSARRVDRTSSLRDTHYDLMGRKVDKTMKGIHIYQGKKVLKR